jgi:hypothetical protein
VGVLGNGSTAPADFSAALVLICSSYPGASLAAAVAALAATEFPP